MKVCVVGAGAIGGYIGALLARSGVEVSLIARGPHLAAIQARGLKLLMGGETIHVHPRATAEAAELGPQDFVVIALKAHSVPPMVERLVPLLGPETAIVMAVNGLPWWYFYRLSGPYENRRVRSVDPDGRQWDRFGPARAIGSVLYQACEIAGPGVIRHIAGDRIPLGEPDGSRSARCQRLAEAFIAAGIKAPIRPHIRNDIWVKLWGNLSFNPVSTLTQATMETIARDPGTRAVVRAMMNEAQAVGEKLGVSFPISVDDRIKAGEEVGAHRTSMLQDMLAGRPLEVDALVGAVRELGALVAVPTPTIDTVHALVVRRAREAGLYPA
ncbi:MAG: 2-dehydropantoate 2-reductase [Alphaproteobacteria bacterium]|nr:2-dehydropantoate 2-reductase [Alphaproteobacteria bacterium]